MKSPVTARVNRVTSTKSLDWPVSLGVTSFERFAPTRPDLATDQDIGPHACKLRSQELRRWLLGILLWFTFDFLRQGVRGPFFLVRRMLWLGWTFEGNHLLVCCGYRGDGPALHFPALTFRQSQYTLSLFWRERRYMYPSMGNSPPTRVCSSVMMLMLWKPYCYFGWCYRSNQPKYQERRYSEPLLDAMEINLWKLITSMLEWKSFRSSESRTDFSWYIAEAVSYTHLTLPTIYSV